MERYRTSAPITPPGRVFYEREDFSPGAAVEDQQAGDAWRDRARRLVSLVWSVFGFVHSLMSPGVTMTHLMAGGVCTVFNYNTRRHGWMTRLLLFVSLISAISLALTNAPRPAAAVEEPPSPGSFSHGAIVLSDYNEILYDKNANVRVAMASTTKMMTAIVAVRYGRLDTPVLIDESDIVGEASMGLTAGTTVTLRGLLYGLLLPSGNDAAHAIARSVGGQSGATDPEQAVQKFVDLMNQTAREYQLRDTHYMNPHGLDEHGHYSTAFDLAIILRAALNFPVLREIMQTPAINIDGYEIWNHNQLYQMRDDVIGGKTGFTDNAGYCLTGAATRDGRFVIAVVVGDDGDNWYTDVSDLLEWGLQVEAIRGIPKIAIPRLVGTQLNQQPGPRQGGP